ncbi:unnamed protein product [Closterium sp. NIES-53]
MEPKGTGGASQPARNPGAGASLPKVEVADRYIGIPGVGPTLKNYVMQLETAQYCWEHDGFDPRFFWKMVVTLAGEVVTIYWMVRKEILDELEQGIIENPTERFVQLLKREFIGQTIVRLEEFWEFRRRKEESFLAYYNHLQELAEDLEKQDERLLVQKFVRSLDDELRPMVRTAVYGTGADVTLKEVYGVAKWTKHAQRLLELDDGETRPRAKPSWAAAALLEAEKNMREHGDPRRCHTCGEQGHVWRDCPSAPVYEHCGRKGHRAAECHQKRNSAEGPLKEDLQVEIRKLQAQLERMPKQSVGNQAMLAIEEVAEEKLPEEELVREYRFMAYPRDWSDIDLRPRLEISGESSTTSRRERAIQRRESGTSSDMRWHPNEGLVCQASVLIAKKGSLTVGGLPLAQAIIDTGAHNVLIGKGLAKQLQLNRSERQVEQGILLMTGEGGAPKLMPSTKLLLEITLLPGTEKECCLRLRGLPLYTGTLWGHRYRTVGDAKSRMLREKVAARGERPGRKEDAAASCLEGAGGVTTADADHVNSARRRSYGA